jgi:Ca-activated chloride channel family protein
MRFVSIFRDDRRPTIGAVAIAALWLTATAPAAQTVFRASTDLVALPVTVVDDKRRYVTDLQREDFGVFEEGVRQEVSLFEASTAPLDLMLLLDTSGSMVSRLPTVRRAALRFVSSLEPDDRAAVVLFDERVRIAQPLSHNRDELARSIQQASSSGGTAFYEAAYIALRELARARRGNQEVRRQALVVLTDGEDNSSRNVAFEDILKDARQGSVTIYTILPPDHLTQRYESDSRPAALFEMRKLAEETGGRFFLPERIDLLPDIYGEIAHELNQQYWLAYVPRQSSPGFKRLSVQILTRPSLRARTRSGYYAAVSRPDAVPASRTPR